MSFSGSDEHRGFLLPFAEELRLLVSEFESPLAVGGCEFSLRDGAGDHVLGGVHIDSILKGVQSIAGNGEKVVEWGCVVYGESLAKAGDLQFCFFVILPIDDGGHADDGRFVGKGDGVERHDLAIILTDDGDGREVAVLASGEHLAGFVGPVDISDYTFAGRGGQLGYPPSGWCSAFG